MRVNAPPAALRFECQSPGARDEHQGVQRINDVVAPVVLYAIEQNVLPANYEKQIEVHPPKQQERGIQESIEHPAAVAIPVGLQGESSNHWDHVQEEDDVAEEHVRDG